MTGRLWRHGDVLIQEADRLPEGGVSQKRSGPGVWRSDGS